MATIPLSALDGYTAVFQLKYSRDRPGILPVALVDVLANDTVVLVSINLLEFKFSQHVVSESQLDSPSAKFIVFVRRATRGEHSINHLTSFCFHSS